MPLKQQSKPSKGYSKKSGDSIFRVSKEKTYPLLPEALIRYYRWDSNTSLQRIKPEDKKSGKKKKLEEGKLPMSRIIREQQLVFLDEVEVRDKRKFGKSFKRITSYGTDASDDIVKLQDLMDAAIFTTLADVNPTFYSFFTSRTCASFTRALVVYMQYFLEVWDALAVRKLQGINKLPHPDEAKWDYMWVNNLNNIRFKLAAEYMTVLTGCDAMAEFYHFKGGLFSNRIWDLQLYELWFSYSRRIVYLALTRKYCKVVNAEMDRLFHIQPSTYPLGHPFKDLNERQIRVLFSPFDAFQVDWKCPLSKELTRPSRTDYIRFCLMDPNNNPDDYYFQIFHAAFNCPEMYFEQANIKIGILGEPRSNYDILYLIPTYVPVIPRADVDRSCTGIIVKKRRPEPFHITPALIAQRPWVGMDKVKLSIFRNSLQAFDRCQSTIKKLQDDNRLKDVLNDKQ